MFSNRLMDRIVVRPAAALLAVFALLAFSATASRAEQYSAQEIVDAGHTFFGETSGGLATLVEKAFSAYGLPNGYVLGEEGSGAIVGGLTYGEGTLYTKNAGDHKVFWQGPSVGWDFGGQGSRAMMLVYNLDDTNNIYRRFIGVAGSAYVVAGLRLQCAQERQRAAGADPHRRRRAARPQCRLSEADAGPDLEPVLIRSRRGFRLRTEGGGRLDTDWPHLRCALGKGAPPAAARSGSDAAWSSLRFSPCSAF